jgi:hypothetical protein
MKKTKTKAKRTNRTKMILVRLTPDERTRMNAAAKTKGLGISAWLRMIALGVLDAEAKTSA